MAVIYRFAAKAINSPGKYLFDPTMFANKVGPHLQHATLVQLGRLQASVETNTARIRTRLQAAASSVKDLMAGTDLVSMGSKPSAAENLYTKAILVPQFKLNAFNNYCLCVNEELAAGRYHLELRLVSPRGDYLMATSADPNKKLSL